MKIGIVQGVIKDSTPDFLLDMFKSTNLMVENWAKRMGYGYHLFDELIKPESLINSPENFVEGFDWINQLHIYKYWWLKKVAPNYDLICWLDSDIPVLGNPDVFSLVNPDKFNAPTGRKIYEFKSWLCEIPNGWFSCFNQERLTHFTDWVENVLTDRSARSDLLITLRTILGKINDEHLLACYMKEEGKDHVNLFDQPNHAMINLNYRDNIIADGLIKNNRMFHLNKKHKYHQFKAIRTYVEYTKYLHVSGKKDSKIRHIIDKFTNEQLDKLYNNTKNKLKELL